MGRFKKGRWKTGGRGPGSKNKRTVVMEQVGLKDWEGLQQFLLTEGSSRMILEIRGLKGREYVKAVSALFEYIKPKLQRSAVDLSIDGLTEQQVDILYDRIMESIKQSEPKNQG